MIALEMVERSCELEILDRGGVPDDLVDRAYREVARIHRFLGDTACLIAAIRESPFPVRRVLDLGCGAGHMLREVQNALGVEAIGIDLSPPRIIHASCPILQGDASRDPLPEADVAYSTYVAHHLSEVDFSKMIRNAGRSSRRLIVLDPVRHWLPLILFRLFVAPVVSQIVARDGATTIRRSYTPAELKTLAAQTLSGSDAIIRHSVTRFRTRQVLDILYRSL